MPATPAIIPRTQPLLGPRDIGLPGEVIKSDGIGGVYWSFAGSGVTDHGDLTGLADDDHTQYALMAGRPGGQTIEGGTGSNESMVIRSNTTAGYSSIEVSNYGLSVAGPPIPGWRHAIHQGNSQYGLAMVGQGRSGGVNDPAAGIGQFVAYNNATNRQWVIGATNGLGTAEWRYLRLVLAPNYITLDAMNGINQRANITFGSSTSNVTFGADTEGPANAKAYFGAESAKTTAVFGTAVGQTANAIEVQSPAGARLSGVGPNGAILNAVFTDATRPAAGIAGRVIYNSDDGNLNIDTGSQWVTPDGTIT